MEWIVYGNGLVVETDYSAKKNVVQDSRVGTGGAVLFLRQSFNDATLYCS